MKPPIQIYAECPAPQILPCGPASAEIAIVGEAPGATEAILRKPFCGASGIELKKMLREAGIDYDACYVTNVFLCQPPRNAVEEFCVPTKQASPAARALGPLVPGGYLQSAFLAEPARLLAELDTVKPKVVIALGNTAMWALTGKSKISAHRGVATIIQLPSGHETVVVATFHPSAILRQFQWRTIAIADFQKALATLRNEPAPSEDLILRINPSLADIETFVTDLHSRGSDGMSVDVETKWGMIRTIGFAPYPNEALVIPFWDEDCPHYWASPDDEVRAWELAAQLLAFPCPKIFQNGAYDISYLWRAHGVRFRGEFHDTMLMHHALQPEMQKSLGFLASIYLDRPAWKVWRQEHAEKKDA